MYRVAYLQNITQNSVDKTVNASGQVFGLNKGGGTSGESERQVQIKLIEVIE